MAVEESSSGDATLRNSPLEPHTIGFYKKADGSLPAREYLNALPPKIVAKMRAVIEAVAKAPPLSFAGGGYWESMKGEMNGWFEIRIDGPPNRTHYRMFCLLDYVAIGSQVPLLVLVDGRTKKFRTTLKPAEYAAVKREGDRYWSINPRPLAV